MYSDHILIDITLLVCSNTTAGWNHFAPGGVPDSHNNFKAARCSSPGGLNLFLTHLTTDMYNACAASCGIVPWGRHFLL